MTEFFHFVGIVPLLWLYGLTLFGRTRGAQWWWLATAYGVSYVPDTAAHWIDPWVAAIAYPAVQAALIGAVLLYRRDAVLFAAALMVVGVLAVVGQALIGIGPDVLLSTVAWGAVAKIAWDYIALGRLRWALLVSFGFGAVAWLVLASWIVYCHGERACLLSWPGILSGAAYQGSRIVGTALFCWAATDPRPRFTLSTPTPRRMASWPVIHEP